MTGIHMEGVAGVGFGEVIPIAVLAFFPGESLVHVTVEWRAFSMTGAFVWRRLVNGWRCCPRPPPPVFYFNWSAKPTPSRSFPKAETRRNFGLKFSPRRHRVTSWVLGLPAFSSHHLPTSHLLLRTLPTVSRIS